ncbi:putative leucine-rich repeat-containing protein DDB_G0290503 isoform X1 [Rhopalosiphum padi]|uniref:putative leucine-rich repeat-containing protein DDB_G0290503 isoform X1 n=1 Tax=Rhopalosiphum padi TaxID=40932 RepID=UPI00298D8E73|nr:putative leucine-rich repeat-containing protein DDB_G0290503 isoform X1 [Rhopalosiphum padi]
MSTPEDNTNSLEENLNSGEKSDTIENDLPLEKLLKLSKSFKTGIDENLNKFKDEKMSMVNEMSSMSSTVIPNEKHIETNDFSKKQSQNKYNKEDSENFLLEENSKTLRVLEQELKNVLVSFGVQHNKNEIKQDLQEKENNHIMCTPSRQNKIGELQPMINFDQTSDEKTNYTKKILEVENKCQYWIDKYDELHDKYLLLESKRIRIEKENCSYQMEISRIKIIENENLRLNQAIDKSNRVRKELEVALESCHEVVYKYQTDVDVARYRVKEAIEMVEKTYSEKDKLLTDLKNSNEKIVKLENELTNLIQEAGTKVNLEVEKVKTCYKDKLREANVEIEFLRTEKQIMFNKTEQISKEYEIIDKKYKSISQKCENEPDSKKLTMFSQQIKEYENTFSNLIADNEILKETNRKLQKSYARKKNKYLMEIAFLKDTTKSLENHLNKAINEISENNGIILGASDRIKTLELEISKLKRPEDNFEQKETQINELIQHVEAQKQVMEMWRNEMHNMIEGFKQKINQLKYNCCKIYKKNRKLRRIIDNSKFRSKYSIIKKKQHRNRRRNKKSNISPMSTSRSSL